MSDAKDGKTDDLEKMIDDYRDSLRPFEQAWINASLDRVMQFLREHKREDFADENDFAEQVMEILREEHAKHFNSEEIRKAIGVHEEELFKYFKAEALAELSEIIDDD